MQRAWDAAGGRRLRRVCPPSAPRLGGGSGYATSGSCPAVWNVKPTRFANRS